MFLLLAACASVLTEQAAPYDVAADVDADFDGYPVAEDCDDTRAAVSPAAAEACDGLDNDCDGTVDEAGFDGAYPDADGDGYGDAARPAGDCSEAATDLAGDCDDARPDCSPDGVETCDGADNNCDGGIDEDLFAMFYADEDGDGAGDPDERVWDCEGTDGWIRFAGDCDDADPTVNAEGIEVCDGRDNDCDHETDEDEVCVVYLGDADVRIEGDIEDGQAGAGIAVLGDTDGNGYAELLVGVAGNWSDEIGDVAIFNGPLADDMTVGDAAASVSSLGQGAAGNTFLLAVGGDLTGDGIGDFVTATSSPEQLLVFADVLGGDTDQAAAWILPIDHGLPDELGPAGDVDGDGISDLAFAGGSCLLTGPFSGAYDAAEDAVTRYYAQDVVLGSVFGDVDGDGMDEFAFAVGGHTKAVVIFSHPAGEFPKRDEAVAEFGGSRDVGSSIPRAGDIDGDGRDDLVVGDRGHEGTKSGGGGAFVLAGPVSGVLTDADATTALVGHSASEWIADEVAVGDFDGDGASDFLIDGYRNAADQGAYLVLGPGPGTIDVTDGSLQLLPEGRGQDAGSALTLADIDLDGLADVVIGAPFYTGSASRQGAAYVVYGASL